MSDVTLVVTSCNRHDLLEVTLRSFAKFNDLPVARTVIVEDSDQGPPKWLTKMPELGEVLWITNGVRKGQLYSCDRAWAEVKTPFCFWFEDDWEFSKPGFMQKSLKMLYRSPNIWTVSLRADDCNGHPNVSLETEFDGRFVTQEPYWNKYWGGCCFNPGLRRLSDYRRIGSYGRLVGYGNQDIVPEQTLSKIHLDMGYRIGVLPDQYIKHIGEKRSKAAAQPRPAKALIAIPACHQYEYGEYKDNRIGHVDRVSNDRVEAVRSTWAKDAEAYKSYVDLKFFYGRSDRTPLSDEVFLDVSDDYTALPNKVKAIIDYALANGYDHLFKCDDDTFVYIDRLLSSGFEHRGYSGYCYPSHGNYISGGPGYWLGKREMKLLSAAKVDGWAEDKWVGGVLKSHGIRPERDARYLPGFARHYVDLDRLPADHSYISFHACTPEMMKRLHEDRPSPTFRMVYNAIGEESFGDASKFELNVRPVEAINAPASTDPASQIHRDPRRAPEAGFSLVSV